MARRNLTDRTLKALKPADKGKPYDVFDAVVPGLGVRVSDTGRRTFVLVSRFPGKSNPTRRALGEYGALTLDDARRKARDWLELIKRNVDPAEEQERHERAEERRRANSFGAVAEDFIAQKLPSERKGREVERDIRREFIPELAARPVTDIEDIDVLKIVNEKKQHAPAQARNLLGIAKRFFSWVVEQRVYGLKVSPVASLKAGKIIGEKVSGDRILDELELLALWRAASRLPYPYGSTYQLLVLTALRLNEVADASRGEFDRKGRLWTIPADRMKGRNTKARAHVVPITDDVEAVLDRLPRFNRGEFVFSTTFGRKPVWMSDKVKKQLDQRILRTMRAVARRRGEDPRKVSLRPWKNHDIRRTVRSGLSRLKVAEEVREAVLAHVRPGIKSVYDLHDYLDEKREALELWGARVRALTAASPDASR